VLLGLIGVFYVFLNFGIIFDVIATILLGFRTILLSLVNVLMTACGKLSSEDNMRIQTLREQRLWVKATSASYPDNIYSLSTSQKRLNC